MTFDKTLLKITQLNKVKYLKAIKTKITKFEKFEINRLFTRTSIKNF